MKRRLSLAVKNRMARQSKVTIRRKMASQRVGLQRRHRWSRTELALKSIGQG